MSNYISLLLFSFLLCLLQSTAWALECYECSSTLDAKCGKEWGYEGNSADKKYLKPCEGNSVACRKQEHHDTHLDEMIVTRSCWSGMGNSTPLMECTEIMSVSEVCYCESEKCNGHQPLLVSFTIAMVALMPLVCRLFF